MDNNEEILHRLDELRQILLDTRNKLDQRLQVAQVLHLKDRGQNIDVLNIVHIDYSPKGLVITVV
jgi:hypothetical protein